MRFASDLFNLLLHSTHQPIKVIKTSRLVKLVLQNEFFQGWYYHASK